MHLLRIYDTQNGFLALDLRHVMAALGSCASECFWKVGGVASYDELLDATGEKADRLEELATSDALISGTELRNLADGVQQIIWGEFRAYWDRLAATPWVTVRAIDSSFYEVMSSDPAVENRVRRAFRDVRAS